MDPEIDLGIDPEITEEVDPGNEQEAWSNHTVPSSTNEWDRGTTYEYSPKERKSFRPPLPRTTTFLILGRILTASTLPGFINRWANTFFPYPSQVLDNLTSLINHMESFNHMVSIILYHLSSPPFITETQGRPCLVHTILNERLTSRFALIEDFQDLIQECEKRVYSCADIPQGTYVEMQRGNQSSIGCEMGMLVLRELARRERTRRFEADLKIWILNTGKWMEDGMKVVEQEEKRVKGEQWILEEDDWFWQDDLYRPME